MELIKFIKKLWSETVAPSLKALSDKQTQNSDKVVKAIQEKKNATDISINNTEDIFNPIVEAQNSTTQAIKDIPPVNIPELDLSTLEGKLEALLVALKDKDLSVKIGKTKVDTKSVVKAIQKLERNLPELTIPEQTDYTLMLDEIMKIMENPTYTTDLIRIQDTLERLSKTEDINALAEYLQALIDKPIAEFPELPVSEKGRIKVEVDRVGGGGGGGLTQIETNYLKTISENIGNVDEIETKLDTLNNKVSTEAKQDDIIANQLSQMMTRIATNSGDDSICYTGQAPIGSSTSEAVWKIVRYDESVSEVAKFAGTGIYDQVWSSRESLTYN